MWDNDDQLFALMRTRLFPAVVGDILDTMGLLKQFLSPGIRPLRSNMVIAGRAMPVLETNCFSASEPNGQLPISRQPFGLLFQALDDLKEHEVYVATGCAPQFALWDFRDLGYLTTYTAYGLATVQLTGEIGETFTASPLWIVEREHIQKVLELVEQNKGQAAKMLEIDRKTLYSKLERYGLES